MNAALTTKALTETKEKQVDLFRLALPMLGCVAMMFLMMRMMGMGGHRRDGDEAPPGGGHAARKAALDAEVTDLRSRIGESDGSST